MKSKADNPSKARKRLAALLSGSIAVTAVLGGTYAVYTDRDTTAEQTLQAGTVAIEVSNEGAITPFTEPIKPMAAGDSFRRYVSLKNTGNLGVTNLSLAQTNSGTPIITDRHGVTVTVETCDEPWVGGACGGTHFENIEAMAPASWENFAFLNLPELAPGDSWHFKFTTHLPAEAENILQDEAGWIQYTFNGVQPTGKNYQEDGTVEQVDEDGRVDASDLRFTILEDGAIQLDWNRVAGATNYQIERTDDPTSGRNKMIVYGDRNSAVDRSVSPETLYYYRVVTIGKTAKDRTPGDWVPVGTYMDMNFQPRLSVINAKDAVELTWTAPGTAVYSKLERYRGAAVSPTTEWETIADGARLGGFNDKDVEKGGKYWYRVTLTGLYGETIVSEPVSQARDLATPRLTAEQPEFTQVRLSWDAIEKAERYDVRKYEGGTLLASYPTTDTTWEETIEPLKSYSYQVEAVSHDTVRSASNRVSVSSDPEVPQLLGLTTVQESATVSWRSVAAAERYHVEYATTPHFADYRWISTTGTSLTVPDLESNQKYYFRVVAVTADWTKASEPNSAYTTTYSATPKLEASTATELSFSWKQRSARASYVLELTDSEGKVQRASTSGSEVRFSGLIPNSSYQARLLTRGGDELELASDTLDVATELGGATLKLSSVQENSAELTWDRIGGATYRLERSTSATMANATVMADETQVTSFSDLGLQPAKQYYYRLTTTVDGDRFESPLLSVKTSMGEVTLTAAATDGGMELNWNQVPGATSYRLELLDDSDGVLYSGTNNSFRHEEAEPGKSYSYRVTARGETGVTSTAQASANFSIVAPQLQLNETLTPTADLIWNSVRGAKSYRVLRSTNASMENATAVYSGTDLSFIDRPRNADAVYYYAVVAVGADFNSGQSNQVEFDLSTRVKDLTAEILDTSLTEASFSWANPGGLTSLTLERYSSKDEEPLDTTPLSASAETFTQVNLAPGSRSYFRLVGETSQGEVYYSSWLTAYQELGAVGEVTVGERTVDSVELSWEPVVGARSYQVSYRLAGQEDWTVGSTSTTTSTKLVGLEGSGNYQLRLTALGAEDVKKATSSILEARTLMAETELEVSIKQSSQSVSLEWENLPRTTVKVERSYSADFTQVETLGESGDFGGVFEDNTLTPSRTAYYRLTITDGVSTQTLQGSGNVALKPGTLEGILAGKAVTLAWTGVRGATSYEVIRNGQVIYSGTATSFSDLVPSLGEDYRYSVRALGHDGSSVDSSAFMVSTDPALPSLGAVATSPFTVDLSWVAPEGGRSYRLERSSAAAFSEPELLQEGVATTYRDEDLAHSTTYYYRLVVVGANGREVTSSVVSVTTPPHKMAWTSTELEEGGRQMKLSWSPVSTATEYLVTVSGAGQIYRGPNSEFTYSVPSTGRNYTLTVQSFTATGGIAAQASDPTTVSVPLQGVAATPTLSYSEGEGLTSVGATVAWTKTPDATSHRLYYRLKNGGTYTYTALAASGDRIGGLKAGRSYEMYLSAVGANGSTVNSEVIETVPYLSPVRGIAARTYATEKSLLITWTGVDTSVDGYRVERSLTPTFEDFETFELLPSSASSYRDATVDSITTYYYRVVTVVNDGGVERTARSTVSAPVESGVNPVSSLTVTNASPTMQTITWLPTPGATRYEVYSMTGVRLTTLEANTTSFTVEGLKPASSYYYFVRAYAPNGSYSSTTSSTLATLWGAPSLTLVSQTSSTVAVKWDPVGQSEYSVQRSLDANFSDVTTVAVLSSSSSSYTYSGLEPGTRYYFRMQSRNTASSVTDSGPVLAATTAFTGAPTIQTVTSTAPSVEADSHSLTVNFMPVRNAETYRLEARSTTNTDDPVVAETTLTYGGTTASSLTLEGLTPGATYYLWLTAENSAGATATSARATGRVGSALPEVTPAVINSNSIMGLYIKSRNLTGFTGFYEARIYSDEALTELVHTYNYSSNPQVSHEVLIMNSKIREDGTYYVTVNSSGDSGFASRRTEPLVIQLSPSRVDLLTSRLIRPVSSNSYKGSLISTWTSTDEDFVSYDLEPLNIAGNSGGDIVNVPRATSGVNSYTYPVPASGVGATTRGYRVRGVFSDGSKGTWETTLATSVNSNHGSCYAKDESDGINVGIYCVSGSNNTLIAGIVGTGILVSTNVSVGSVLGHRTYLLPKTSMTPGTNFYRGQPRDYNDNWFNFKYTRN